MTWAMSELVKNPETMEKERDKLSKERENGRARNPRSIHYLKSFIKENILLHPAITITGRKPRKKCEISGYQIPMTTAVHINILGLARDPDIWTEPESFKPERFKDSPVDNRGANFEMIPFGRGRRICPGISFAIPSIELALAHMLYYSDRKLLNRSRPEELNMGEPYGITVRRKHDLCLIATVRFPFGNRDIRNN